MPTITIDDKQITVPNGTLILQAARQLDIEIPVFCYHSRLASVGMCRMCLVQVATPKMGPDRKPVLRPDGTPELQWNPKTQTACTMVVSEGMLVDASSQVVHDARRGIIEFLLTSHPLDCPICDKGGECPLQEQALTYGPGLSRFVYNDKFINEKNVPLGPLIVLDRERCVQCARCIRFQDEIADDHVLGFYDRGRGMEIITYSDPPFDSKFSGNTTDICPVGALTTTDFRFEARPWEVKYIPTVCPHCSVGCNLTMSVRNDLDIKRILPRTNASVNDIWICDKGRFAHHFVTSPKRLSTPLIRKNGELVEASWDEAIDLVSEKFGAAKAKDPHSIAGLAGDRAPNEDLYLFNKFFKEVLGSDNLSSVVEPDDLNATVGLAANSDIGKMGKGNLIFVIGSDVEEEAPIAFLRIKQGKDSGANLIVANGRPTKLDRYATVARYRYGTEGQLLASLLHVTLNENLANAEFVAARTTGFDALKDQVRAYDPDSIAERVGWSAEDIRKAARAIAQAKDVVFVYGHELTDPAARELLKTLALVSGHVGRANNGVWPMLAHNNTQGARDLLPPAPNASHPALHPAHALHPAGQAGQAGQAGLAVSPERGAKVLYVMGAEAVRDGAEFVVVQDILLTPTAQSADVVLPAQSFAEREGTFTNHERRVQYFARARLAPEGSQPDWMILTELANALDYNWRYPKAADVFAELVSQVPAYHGMSYAKLMGRPQRSRLHFLYEGTSFETQGGQGLVWPSAAEKSDTQFELKFIAPAAPPANGLRLVAPRLLYDAGTLISETELLYPLVPTSYAELNRVDAERLQIVDGDKIRLKTASGTLEVTARVDGHAPPSVVVAPMNLKPADTRTLLQRGQVATLVTILGLVKK